MVLPVALHFCFFSTGHGPNTIIIVIQFQLITIRKVIVIIIDEIVGSVTCNCNRNIVIVIAIG